MNEPKRPLSPAPRRVGILGGMGPAATLDLMAKVLEETPAARDEDHVPLVVWNVPQVPPRVAAMRGAGPSPLPAMLEGARFLERAGATALAVACNTAHHWARELAAGISIPLLHIADAAVHELAARADCPRRVALAGTRATIESGFFAERLDAAGIAHAAPSEPQQAAIDRAIAHVKRGALAEARTEFEPAARALLEGGAQAIVLACTELPLVPCEAALRARCVDPTRALAREIVRHALGIALRR
jgi:aspartate racemase